MRKLLLNISFVKSHNLFRKKNRLAKAQDFHLLINKIIDNGKDLKKLRNFEFTGLNKIPLNFWSEFLISVENKERNIELIERIERVPATLLTPGEWNELSMYMVYFGFFKIGYSCRLKSYSSLEHYRKIFPLNIFYNRAYIVSLLERGDILNAKEAFNTLFIPKNTEFDFYFRSLFLNDESIAKKIDPKFYELINNKSIAVVGPLNLGESYGDEIESADLIIRLNQSYETQAGIKPDKEGKRTDIVYYANLYAKKYQSTSFKEVPTDINIKCIVFRTPIEYNGPLYKRTHLKSDSMEYNGSFTLGQALLFDILPFRPKSVKIYGADFYTSYNKYSASYSSYSKDIPFTQIFVAHVLHDLFTQFVFAKLFFDKKMIAGDNIYSAVLSLSIYEYLSKMEEIYPVYRIN